MVQPICIFLDASFFGVPIFLVYMENQGTEFFKQVKAARERYAKVDVILFYGLV